MLAWLRSGPVKELHAFVSRFHSSGEVMQRHYTVFQKNIPDIFDCNLKTNYQILIIFDKNIPDTSCQQKTIQFPTSPNVCFSTTWGNTTS